MTASGTPISAILTLIAGEVGRPVVEWAPVEVPLSDRVEPPTSD